MGHLNVISLFWLIVLIYYSRYVIKQEEHIRNRYLKIQLSIVLGYNIAMLFVFPWKLPVELSTVSYFVVPLIMLFNIKKLQGWGVYSAILAGVVYYLAMIIIGNKLYADYPAYSVYTSIFNHGALLSYAYIMLSTVEFKKSDRYIIWIGIILSALWAQLLRPHVVFAFRIFIYEVLDGLFVKTYFPNHLTIGYVGYYVWLVLALYFSASIVHSLSKRLYKKA